MPGGASPRVLLVGCGKMGGALLAGWLEGALTAADVAVVEPNEAAAATLIPLDVSAYRDVSEVSDDIRPSVLLFAVKPQIMSALVPPYKRFAGSDVSVLSIAAGCPIALFEGHLGRIPIVRAMPNTPAAIGRGITVACANPQVKDSQRKICEELLEAVGEVVWVEDEALMDPVTAVSGSGPAYVFLLIECLAEAGVEAGLDPGLATRLARATVSGAGELVRRSDQTAGILRENVTSPGGTTAAALEVLMAEDGLKRLMGKAVLAAARRSRELAG